MINTEKIKFQAALYQFGLECGVFEKEEIIIWCDKIIDCFDEPPFEIIELSLMSNQNEANIVSKLRDFAVGFDIVKIADLLLSILSHKLSEDKLGLKVAIKCVSKLLLSTQLWSEQEFYKLYGYEDKYYLAASGVYSSLKGIDRDFKNAISNYDRFFNEAQEVMSL